MPTRRLLDLPSIREKVQGFTERRLLRVGEVRFCLAAGEAANLQQCHFVVFDNNKPERRGMVFFAQGVGVNEIPFWSNSRDNEHSLDAVSRVL